MPDPAPASLAALIGELESQLARLPAGAPETIDAMVAALGDSLAAFAAGLRNGEPVDTADLQRVQRLLAVYAGLLSRQMASVGRGLEVFGLAEPVYRDASAYGLRPTGTMRATRAAITA